MIDQKIGSIYIGEFKNTKNHNIFTLGEKKEVFFIDKECTQDNKLKVMQAIVGGYIERYPEQVRLKFHTWSNAKSNDVYDTFYDTKMPKYADCEIIVNDSGLVDGLPHNKQIQRIFGVDVFGIAILLEGGLD
tara:strand:+ start:134 stop:529 length:396 start_codon:yes stop_codon:yes gene_type:complete